MVLCIYKSSETMVLCMQEKTGRCLPRGRISTTWAVLSWEIVKSKNVFSFPTMKLKKKSEHILAIRRYISIRFNRRNIVLLVYTYLKVSNAMKYLFLPWWLLNIIQGTFSGGFVSANIPLFIYPADNMCILSQQTAENIHTTSAAAEEDGFRKNNIVYK